MALIMKMNPIFACCVVLFTFVYGCSKSQHSMEADSQPPGNESEFDTETTLKSAEDESTDSDAASDSSQPKDMTTDSRSEDGDTESHAADSGDTDASGTETAANDNADTDTLAETDNTVGLYPGPCTESRQHFGINGLESHLIASHTYNVNGNLIESETVSVIFDRVVRRTTYTYDENDRLTSMNFDSDADSIIDGRINYTYASDGALLTEDRYEDNDGNDTWQTRKRTTYDASGNVVSTELDEVDWLSEDVAIDGVWDQIIRYAYDDNGHLVRREEDYNADGVTDILDIKTYDDQGNMVRDEQDHDMDGVFDRTRVHQYTYDDAGNMLIERYDNDGDGVIEKSFTRTFDDQSRIISLTETREETGYILSIITYTYDDAGNVVLEDTDVLGDGTIDSRDQHEYNDAGLLLRFAMYMGTDELATEVIYTYDPHGNPLDETSTSPVLDSVGYTVETYNYDCWE